MKPGTRNKKKKIDAQEAKPTNVFRDMGFSIEDAAAFQLRTDIHSAIIKVVQKRRISARELERILDRPQSRISELLTGKISKMSAERLVGYLAKLGFTIRISTRII